MSDQPQTKEVNRTNSIKGETQTSQGNENETTKTQPNQQLKKQTSLDRTMSNLLQKAGNSKVEDIVNKVKPIFDFLSKVIKMIIPYAKIAYEQSLSVYNSLPHDIIMAILGLLLAFFGGIYCLLIAAIEAFMITGYRTFMELFYKVRNEAVLIWEANEKDNQLDEDNNGKADVLELTVSEVVVRKSLLFFKSCKDPDVIVNFIPDMVTCIISVIAVLKVEFAKVITLGYQIGENLRKPVCYFSVPVLKKIVPSDYHKWICPINHFLCKMVAISIAWFIQRIISSVQSGIRGGLMFSRNFLMYLKKQGIFPGYNEDDYFDEILGWSVAALGIYFQLRTGFGLPFPLNFMFFPASVAESALQWAVSE